jgi:hypothetical protein
MQLPARSRVVASDRRLNGTRANLQESVYTSAFLATYLVRLPQRDIWP